MGTVTDATGIRGFVVDGADVGLLGNLGGTETTPHAINEAGQIVGEASLPPIALGRPGPRRAFLTDRSTGVLSDLGTLGGDESRAYDINEAGVIVGQSTAAGSAVFSAFVLEGGTMHSLDTVLAEAAGITLTEARGINDDGRIAASGFDLNAGTGAQRAFLLTPVPLPPSWVGLLAGLAVLAARRRRRARGAQPPEGHTVAPVTSSG